MLIHDPPRLLDLVNGPLLYRLRLHPLLDSSRLSGRSLNRRLKLLSKTVPSFDSSAPTTWNASSSGRGGEDSIIECRLTDFVGGGKRPWNTRQGIASKVNRELAVKLFR